MQNPIRILLVDDNLHFLEAARGFLESNESLEVAGTANEAQAALGIAGELKPDVILLDLNLGGQSGLDLIPRFKQKLPETKIIVISIMEKTSYQIAAIQAGADAFVHKSDMIKMLFPVILNLTGRMDALNDI